MDQSFGAFPEIQRLGSEILRLNVRLPAKRHHRSESFQQEIQRLWKEQNIQKDIKWFWEET